MWRLHNHSQPISYPNQGLKNIFLLVLWSSTITPLWFFQLCSCCNYLETDSLWGNSTVRFLKQVCAWTKHLIQKTRCVWNITLVPYITHYSYAESSFSYTVNKKEQFLFLLDLLCHFLTAALGAYKCVQDIDWQCLRDHKQ